MATKIYTAIEYEASSVGNIPRVSTAAVTVTKTGSNYTVDGAQSQVDIIDALGTWTAQ